MADQQHPIAPPPELVQQLQAAATIGAITIAYQAGADAELEACCDWLDKEIGAVDSCDLRAARRPKPPSLKEQALCVLESLNGECLLEGFECPEKVAIIRRALESLPD